MQLSKSQDGKYVFIACMSRTATELRVLDADVPQNSAFKLFRTRQPEVEVSHTARRLTSVDRAELTVGL